MLSQFLPDLGFGLVTASVLMFGVVAFTIQYGITSVPNFAFGDQMTVGAYLAWLFDVGLHWNLWLSGLMGAVLLALLSIGTGRYVFGPFQRKRANLFTMLVVTFLFGIILQNLVQLIFGPSFQAFAASIPQTVVIAGMIFTSDQVVILGVAMACMVALHLLLQYTQIGIAMRAMVRHERRRLLERPEAMLFQR